MSIPKGLRQSVQPSVTTFLLELHMTTEVTTPPATPDLRTRLASDLKLYTGGDAPSEAGVRSAELLDRWLGLHHVDSKALKAVDWTNPRYQAVRFAKYSCSGLSSFDFNNLTTLIFLAHDLAIRVEISGRSNGGVDLVLHPRQREGGFSQRHPTIEAALEEWRKDHPAGQVFSTAFDQVSQKREGIK